MFSNQILEHEAYINIQNYTISWDTFAYNVIPLQTCGAYVARRK